VEDEEISPNEYFRLVNSAKVKTRRRASKAIRRKEEEAPGW